jgi:hypothetical protein
LVNGFGSETSKLRRLAFSWKTEKMDWPSFGTTLQW